MNQRATGQTNKILVDASVLLADPDVVLRIPNNGGLAFVARSTLEDLDAVSKGQGANAMEARTLLQQLAAQPAMRLQTLPTGHALQGQDTLALMSYQRAAVYLLTRPSSRPRPGQVGGLVELARDYDMVLLTGEPGLMQRAEKAGVQVAPWRGSTTARPSGTQTQSPRSATPRHLVPGAVQPFAICQKPITEADAAMAVSQLPGSGDTIRVASAGAIRVGAQISAGGEGIIYEVPGRDQVCKVYHQNKLTQLKRRKIELMVSRRIERPGICWPTEIATNAAGEFVGYLMPRAHGQTMQSTMFVKPKLEKTFPAWTRRDLVNVAGTFLNHVEFLHRHNIIIGDINPMNLLVTQDSRLVWMVDTDSFQIEAFPCPVGTVNFTAPEIQGRNYAEFLRTVDHELFAVATMIFMILFPGKAPYSQQGGGSPADNIKSRNFPYRFSKQSGQSASEVSGEDAPRGPWQFIWSHLPLRMRQAFFETFQEGHRVSIAAWQEYLNKYWYQLDRGYALNEMFPLHFWVKNPVEVICSECSRSFTTSQNFVDKLKAQSRTPWCPPCQHRFRLVQLARESKKAADAVTGAPAPKSTPTYRNTGWKPTPVVPAAPRPPVWHSPPTAPRPSPPQPQPVHTTPRRTMNYVPAPTPPSLADIVKRFSQFFRK